MELSVSGNVDFQQASLESMASVPPRCPWGIPYGAPGSSAILSYLKAVGGLRMHCFTSISIPKIHGQNHRKGHFEHYLTGPMSAFTFWLAKSPTYLNVRIVKVGKPHASKDMNFESNSNEIKSLPIV